MVQRGGDQVIPRPPGWRAGGPPPWHGVPAHERRFSLDEVHAALRSHPVARRDTTTAEANRAAAVLLALFEEAGEARLILTKRPEHLPTHQGQIAFPGGKLDPGLDDDLAAAALREAHEEIGLDPAAVRVIAELDHIGTVVSAFSIAPFVGALDERPSLVPAPGEVTAVFDVALSELLAEETWREEIWDLSWAPAAAMPFFELPGETVWGATARILANLLTFLTTPR
jgi:8-oxo-dGTP pyrophosphatase MutT (NUDIX family)